MSLEERRVRCKHCSAAAEGRVPVTLEEEASAMKPTGRRRMKCGGILHRGFLGAWEALVKSVMLASTLFQAYLAMKLFSTGCVDRQVLYGTHVGNHTCTEFFEIAAVTQNSHHLPGALMHEDNRKKVSCTPELRTCAMCKVSWGKIFRDAVLAGRDEPK